MVFKPRLLVKCLFQVILLVLLLKYFGFSSWERYHDEKTLVTSAEKEMGEIPAPTVTVCAYNHNSYLGYKDNSLLMTNFPTYEIVGEICKGFQGEDIVRCLEEKTYNFSTVIEQATKGPYSSTPQLLTNTTYWHPEFSYSSSGLCYQLESNTTLGTDMAADLLSILLNNNNVTTYVSIHDTNFFFQSSNPLTPITMIPVDKTMLTKFYLVQHNNLDLASKPCNPDPLYSFTGCIKNTISREVGCRLYWDRWSDKGLPVCDNLKQYGLFEKRYGPLQSMVMKDVANLSGCQLPCTYNEYKIISTVSTDLGRTEIILWNINPFTLVMTEELLYGLSSFIAEVGGTLGLFLGFSFMTLWDGMEEVTNILVKMRK